jgi:hypothetical protein
MYPLHSRYGASKKRREEVSKIRLDWRYLLDWFVSACSLLLAETERVYVAAILLFIFAVTQGSNEGWGKAGVITPLIISVVLVILFFIWERRMPEGDASLCVISSLPLSALTDIELMIDP